MISLYDSVVQSKDLGQTKELRFASHRLDMRAANTPHKSLSRRREGDTGSMQIAQEIRVTKVGPSLDPSILCGIVPPDLRKAKAIAGRHDGSIHIDIDAISVRQARKARHEGLSQARPTIRGTVVLQDLDVPYAVAP
eukprot:scaffold655_cov162-Amphora_coffeaeformis.AAC.8